MIAKVVSNRAESPPYQPSVSQAQHTSTQLSVCPELRLLTESVATQLLRLELFGFAGVGPLLLTPNNNDYVGNNVQNNDNFDTADAIFMNRGES